MGNRQTLGIVTVLAGTLLVIGAVRGTWQKLFKDVVLGQQDNPTGAGIGAAVGGAIEGGVPVTPPDRNIGAGIGGAVGQQLRPPGSAIGEIVGQRGRPPQPQTSVAARLAAGIFAPFAPSNTPASPAPGIAGSVYRQAGG